MAVCISLSAIYFIGGHPKDLKLGILNLETESCSNFSEICTSEFESCNFVDELRNPNYSFVLRNFQNLDDAQNQLKKGKISGFLVLAKNFTKVSLQFNKKPRRKSDVIDVYLDQSDFIIFKHIKESITKSFMDFHDKLGLCRQKRPIVALRREDLYGTLSLDMQSFYVGYILIGLSLFHIFVVLKIVKFSFSGSITMFMTITCLPISSARSEGVWNLTLLAGVKSYEVLLAHFLFSFLQCLIMVFESLFSFWLFCPLFGDAEKFWFVFCIQLEIAVACILFEFWLSHVTGNFTSIFYINLGLAWNMNSIGGMNW
jgi:hypothetical protein